MITTSIYTTIADNQENVLCAMFGLEPAVFSVDTVEDLLSKNPTEKDFRFNINSNGGSVAEGLKIYDKLRMSGKNLFMNIEGGCHSMTVAVMLAAPLENRTANKNARSLIHQVRVEPSKALNLEDVENLAVQIKQEQDAILDIYADRTGTDRDVLEALMKEERYLTAEELLQYGFISKINAYTTNKKSETMSKETRKALLDRLFNFQKEATALLNEEPEVVNYDFKDADGNTLFTTNKEDDSLAVNDAATPDGTHELPDGRKVTIENSVITNIAEPVTEDPNEAALTEANNRIAALENQLKTANSLLTDLKNEMGSNVVIPGRVNTPGARPTNLRNQVETVEQLKAEAKEKRNKFKGRTA